VEVKAQWTHRELMALAGAWRINKAETPKTSAEPNGIEDNAQHYEIRLRNYSTRTLEAYRFWIAKFQRRVDEP
jgi:transposase